MSHLATALLHFQADPPAVHLDATNPHFGSKFASLGGVVAAVRPALTKHGLVVSQLPTYIGDGVPALETRLMHPESGEEIKSLMPLMMTKQDPQAQGSALTYARRYALLSILGLVGDTDDDAASTVSPQRGDGRGERAGVESVPGSAGFVQAPRASDPQQMIVPFGKHKGKKISEVPTSYWEWWLGQDGNKNPEVLAAVELHLGLTAQPVGAPDDSDIPF